MRGKISKPNRQAAERVAFYAEQEAKKHEAMAKHAPRMLELANRAQELIMEMIKVDEALQSELDSRFPVFSDTEKSLEDASIAVARVARLARENVKNVTVFPKDIQLSSGLKDRS